jgi:putative hydrolase of the HAD superfamily
MDLRAVVFDYGMVLSAPPEKVAHSGLVDTTGLSKELFDQHYWADREDYDAGILDGITFWEKLARDAGLTFSPEQMSRLLMLDAKMWMSLNKPVLAWAQQVRAAGFKIGILSNIGDEMVKAMRNQFAWLKDFDQCTWSYELGTIKPHPEIYLHTLDKLGVEPQQALFLDDRAANVRGAEAVGMHGIVFSTIGKLIDELKSRGFDRVLPLPAQPLMEEAKAGE